MLAYSRLFAVGGALVALTCTGALAQNPAVPGFKEIDSIEARVQGCVTCHGRAGQGTDNGI